MKAPPGVPEAAPGLLHNVGGPPRATISWRGFGRAHPGAVGPGGPQAAGLPTGPGGPAGVWLQLSISIGAGDARYRRDWNTAAALLGLVEPGHGLPEPAAERHLIEFIEEQTRRLSWPACLLARRGSWTSSRAGDRHVALDHVATTFVALAKCTGSLWLRERRVHLAPLQAPALVEPGGVPMQGVRWSQMLWFPQGLPQESISRLGTPRPAGAVP